MVTAFEARRRILMASDAILPPMYGRCDYLQAQGDRAVIDTGVAGDNDLLRFSMRFNVDRFLSYRGFFTNYDSESANTWRLSEGNANTSILFNTNTRTGSSRYITTDGTFAGKDITFNVSKSAATLIVDGIAYTPTIPVTTGTANNSTIYINSSRRYAQTRDDVIKWYYFKVWDNDILIRNYIPCYRKSDNLAGFYDTVNQTFNPSIGTADFVAGYDQ